MEKLREEGEGGSIYWNRFINSDCTVTLAQKEEYPIFGTMRLKI